MIFLFPCGVHNLLQGVEVVEYDYDRRYQFPNYLMRTIPFIDDPYRKLPIVSFVFGFVHYLAKIGNTPVAKESL